MLAKVLSTAVVGLDAHLIEVEVDIGGGLPQFSIVGLPDAIVRESRDRVRSALKNSGFRFPVKKITVNLAPAGIKKEGSGLDLAIAMGILAADHVINQESLERRIVAGELSLDGRVKAISGGLAIGLAFRGTYALFLAADDAKEAAILEEAETYPVRTLPELVDCLNGKQAIDRAAACPESFTAAPSLDDDFADVKGQDSVKRGLEVAASGGHNVLMVGPPGSGKTMLAKCLPGVLPPMHQEEALETSKIHSVLGLLPEGRPFLDARPFRAPHHSISEAGFIGGGSIPHPGEISLAHNGVLFLDETLEFKRSVLEGLRQPLEEGCVTLTRVNGSLRFPARVMLVAAMNPCPCGYWGDPKRECVCTPYQIRRYRGRLSGPLMDRLDIQLVVPSVPFTALHHETAQESSGEIRARVMDARDRQARRFHTEKIFCNAQMKPRHIKKYCTIAHDGRTLLDEAMTRLGLSARAYGRILRVARTIADLADAAQIESEHLAEAIQYRTLDRQREV